MPRHPIPIPPKLKWREFRYRFLPPIVMGASFLAVLGLWIANVESPVLVGKVIERKSRIIAPVSGRLLSLNVKQFQRVEAGQTLGIIKPFEVKTQLDSLRLEADLIRSRLDPLVEQKRNAVSYYRLRLEWLQQRVALASSKVKLQRAKNELTRDARLFEEGVISADQLDQTQKSVAALKAEVNEAEGMISELSSALKGLTTLDDSQQTDMLIERLGAALLAQEAELDRLEALAHSYPLKAPISGKVVSIDRLPDEVLMKGERILSIVAETSTELLVYLKSPLAEKVEKGDLAWLQTRGKDPRQARARVSGISPVWENLSDSGARRDFTNPFDRELGLPILMILPPDLHVRPGELVDVFFKKP